MRDYKILLFLSLFIVISNSLELNCSKNREDLWWFLKEIENNYEIVEIKCSKRKLLQLIKLRIKRRLFLIKIIRNILLIILTLILLSLISNENHSFLGYLFIFSTIKIKLKEFEKRTVLYSNEFIEISEILTKEGKKYYSIIYKKDTVTIIDSNDLLCRDYEMVRLHESRSLKLEKIIREAEIGSCFGISRQRTSHKCAKYKKGGIRELLRCYGRYKINAEAIERASEIKLKSPDISYSAIAKILQKENLVSGISGATIREALCGVGKQTNLIEKFSRDKLILRLLEIVDGLISKVSEFDKNEYIDIKPIIEMIRNYRETKKSKKKRESNIKPLSRKHLEEIKERKRIGLKEMLLGIKHREGNCPLCNTPGSYQRKRERKYTEVGNNKEQSFTKLYLCKNENCEKKYFSVPPVAVRLSQWFTNKVQGIAIRSIMGAGSVYKKAYKFLADTKLIKIAASTVFRWLQRLGEECIEISEILGIKYSGVLCIDEKWVKVLGRWYYVFFAVDAVTLDLVCIDIFEDNSSYSAKTFLLELKSAGYNPKIIVTDMLTAYPNVILEVFPLVIHKECILHAKWSACRIIRKYIKSGGLDECAKELKKKLYKYFNSETEKQLNIRYKKLQRIKENYVKSSLLEIYELIERVYPKLLISIKDKEVPKTNNYVERVIREFNSKYKNICGFGSYWCARNYIKVFSVYYRFRKFEEGARKGKSPLELAGYDIKDKDFVDYLVAFI